MRTSWKFAAVALLLAFGVCVGYGWGSVTHVWYADKLGVKFGPLNQNEMYGAVLPDLFGYDFSEAGFTADYALHTSGELLWSLYGAAVSPEARAGIYGMFTHSNSPVIKGADWYAHGVYPIPNQTLPDPHGWVIHQGMILIENPHIANYVKQLLKPYPPVVLQTFLPVVGHTLIETAVDILVKRNEDPLVGARLYLAAKNRSNEIPGILEGVFPGGSNAEAEFRQQMLGYGQLFLLKEPLLIEQLSTQTAGLGEMFLSQIFGITLASPIDPSKIAEFLQIAIQQVRPIYRMELLATLFKVDRNMRENAPPPAGPIFAFWGKETIQDEFEGVQTSGTMPTELSLDQNYPNPFNPTTTIAFALPDDQIVSLKIYNTIGQEVATLVNEFKTAGRYSAVWDAKGIPSGVYFCRLQAGNVVDTKKMTLLK